MILTTKNLTSFREYLARQDRSGHTIEKYVRDARKLLVFANGKKLTQTILLEFKRALCAKFSPISVNSMLAGVNALFEFLGKRELKLKPVKIQKEVFSSDEKELSKTDYEKLIKAAERRHSARLSLIVQTICSTGIRVSELKFITAEAVASGVARINCKGKHRVVYLPESLRALLKNYLRQQKITTGAVFVTRTGKPVDRSNIWREMKKLGGEAHVSKRKIFPHNLRHLFARTYYALEKDITHLADILGHSSIDTTRIYTKESGQIHARRIERLNLVLTT